MEGEGALVGVEETLTREGVVIGAWARGGWEESKMEGQPVSLCVEWGTGEASAVGEKTCGGGEAMQTPSVMAPDARNSSSEEEAVWEATARHVWKWKG